MSFASILNLKLHLAGRKSNPDLQLVAASAPTPLICIKLNSFQLSSLLLTLASRCRHDAGRSSSPVLIENEGLPAAFAAHVARGVTVQSVVDNLFALPDSGWMSWL